MYTVQYFWIIMGSSAVTRSLQGQDRLSSLSHPKKQTTTRSSTK